jgi:glycosyltransferase involved in cell wall biosynthesis
MKIAIITAGGAGMFCGSCMQDNTLARALRLAGADAVLLPTYTPIRVDEENESASRLFLGGINVYLDSKLPGWSLMPRVFKRWLDRPAVVQFLSRRSSSTDAGQLGDLTIDLLRGSQGPQRAEINELISFLCDDLRPDVVLFSNALLSGIVRELKSRFSGRIACLLQGDDVFLEALSEPWKSQARELVSRNAAGFDRLLTHSRYYSDFMQRYLNLPASGFRTIPLTVDADSHRSNHDLHSDSRLNDGITGSGTSSDERTTIGYFARICPEKGVFHFLDAAADLVLQRADIDFVIAGFLPELHRVRFEKRLRVVQKLAGSERVRWEGSPADRDEKFRILRSFDWLCVPTEYHEPKGLYVLEAALAGVPSLLPNHGAFPERVADLRIGQLYEPGSRAGLTEAILNLSSAAKGSTPWNVTLRDRCLERYGMATTGVEILSVIGEILQSGSRQSDFAS